MRQVRGTSRAVAALIVLVVMATFATGEDRFYHVQRAVFRCSPLNRGLAFDGRNFWVGEFGGWVRCYDLQGRPLPDKDLGGGTIQNLGHGVATGRDFVVTGAFDSVAPIQRSSCMRETSRSSSCRCQARAARSGWASYPRRIRPRASGRRAATWQRETLASGCPLWIRLSRAIGAAPCVMRSATRCWAPAGCSSMRSRAPMRTD